MMVKQGYPTVEQQNVFFMSRVEQKNSMMIWFENWEYLESALEKHQFF